MSQLGQSRHFDPLPATSGPPPIADIAPTPVIERIETTAASETAPYGRGAKSQAAAYSRVLALLACGIIAPRQNNIAHLRRRWRAIKSLSRPPGAAACEMTCDS